MCDNHVNRVDASQTPPSRPQQMPLLNAAAPLDDSPSFSSLLLLLLLLLLSAFKRQFRVKDAIKSVCHALPIRAGAHPMEVDCASEQLGIPSTDPPITAVTAGGSGGGGSGGRA